MSIKPVNEYYLCRKYKPTEVFENVSDNIYEIISKTKNGYDIKGKIIVNMNSKDIIEVTYKNETYYLICEKAIVGDIEED